MIRWLNVPQCYKDFKCVDRKCTDSCCAGWQVDVDGESWEYYKTVGGKFGEYIHSVMVDLQDEDFFADKGQFRLKEDGRCPFLNDEGLCDMFTELGEERLCKTCTNYPRFMEDYGELREVGLAFSCPEAARLMLESDKPMEFLKLPVSERGEYSKDDINSKLIIGEDSVSTEEKSRIVKDIMWRTKGMGVSDSKELSACNENTLKEGFQVEVEAFDKDYFDLLYESRNTAWFIVRERSLSIEKRVALLLDYCVALQNIIDSTVKCGDSIENDEIIECSSIYGNIDEMDLASGEIENLFREIWGNYSDADWIKKRYDFLLEGVQAWTADEDAFQLYGEKVAFGELRYNLLPEYAAVIYQELKHCKPEWGPMLTEAEDILHNQREVPEYYALYREFDAYYQEKQYEYEHLLNYFVFKYFLKAYFDDDVYGKGQLMVMGYLVLKELAVCRWIKQEKCFSTSNQAELFHLYSRELEHSDENYEAFLEMLRTENMCNFEHLLALLVEISLS